jgi:transcription elongation GreA/GreB family factor
MGISSGVYLGNEITWENKWATIEKKVKEARDATDRKDSAAYNRAKKEITTSLESIYSKT